MEGVGVGCAALDDGGDEVGAAQPVGFGEVGGGGLGGVTGVGMVKACNLKARGAYFAQGLDEIAWSDPVVVSRSCR